jgi:SPX domain protein involved in polyphosphate accumulation
LAALGGAYLGKIDRYELKYIIPYSLVEPITKYIEPYCVLDANSYDAPGWFYQVNSLYFDTPNLTFAKNRLYVRSPRFNMRVRAYADGSSAPYFLEIKVKDGNAINKFRAKIDECEWPAIFTDPHYVPDRQGSPREMQNKILFFKTALKYNAAPRIYTRYRRRAFVSTVDEYVRVTMDIDLQAHLESRYTLIADPERLQNYDSEIVYAKDSERTNGSGVILELKCYPHQVPLWMLDLIREFELTRTSFSKYVASLQSMIAFDPFFNQHPNCYDYYHMNR